MDTIYLKTTKVTNDCIHVDLNTLLVIYVYKTCDRDNVKLNVVLDDLVDQPQFKVFLKPDEYNLINASSTPQIATYCIWPIIVVGNTIVAGLCSVSRQIIKSSLNQNVRNLLGFREACLMACSESSIWTKFCEVDMIQTVKDVLSNFELFENDFNIILPTNLTRFEYHMEQPVRIHNVYKVAREKNNDKDIKSSVPLRNLNIPHCYSEGPYLTLADVLLYPCYMILINIFGENIIESQLPLTYLWFKKMEMQSTNIIKFDSVNNLRASGKKEVVQKEILKQSLYTTDPNRYKPQNRIFTKQNYVQNALNIVASSGLKIVNNQEPFGYNIDFDWSNIPLQANPMGGSLPKKRANRKCEQLENLAKAVLKIAHEQTYKIVDFCSGSGHLGILLATLLPNCEIMLVENKEKSLLRAKERIMNLDLKNVILLQCNMDYFKAKFDLGVSLHACGVATDLVIQNCIENKAHFVSCPCCYGGIHDCYHLKYPRSSNFISFINCGDYLNVAHAADQTHDKDNVKTKQGYECMDIIDTDRKLYAESCGYDVYLGKLLPTSCTPKNNLIVGIFK